ncbi:MAG: hypothetical protein ACOVQT_01010, partial [Rubrivivax sp.]
AGGAQASGRSHFEAQDELESGTPGVKTTPDGWMGRLLTLGGDSEAVRAVYAGPNRPRLEIVDAGREDVGPLGTSLRSDPVDQRLPTGFER